MVTSIRSTLSCCAVLIMVMMSSSTATTLRSSSASSTPKQQIKRFTAYTKPLTLNPGEVTNKFHTLKIPQGPIVVYRFEADVVEKNSQGQYIPVPVSDAYLHHHVVGSSHKSYHHLNGTYSPMKPSSKISKGIGFGAGTESRGTPQEFPYPYGFITSDGEDEWTANVHIINTRYMTETDAHHCLECPCIPNENMFNKSKFGSMKCNIDLQYENNTSCYPEFYHGGLRCCEDDVYCLSKKYVTDIYNNNENMGTNASSTYYLRYTIEYSDVVTKENKPLYLAGCCDATGNMTSHGAVEYDIQICDKSKHPGCVHTLTTIQTLNAGGYTVYDGGQKKKKNDTKSRLNDDNRIIELVYAVGHQHRGGLGIHMYDVKTNNLICSSIPTYGSSSTEEIGNEKDYIVSMSTCTFNPPIKMKSNDLVKIVAKYDNTQSHTGVMSLFYIAIADVIDDNDNDDDLPKTTTSITTSSSSETTEQHSSSIDTMSSSSSSFLSFLTLESVTINIVSYVVIGIIIVIAIFYAVRYTYNYRRGYTSIELSKPL